MAGSLMCRSRFEITMLPQHAEGLRNVTKNIGPVSMKGTFLGHLSLMEGATQPYHKIYACCKHRNPLPPLGEGKKCLVKKVVADTITAQESASHYFLW
jgi:hypothetical protein